MFSIGFFMKLITKLSTAIAFGLVSLSASVFAQSGTPVTCVWTSGGASGVSYRLCRDGSATGPVAASEVTNLSTNTCNLAASTGYSVTGSCGTANVYKIIVPPACPKNGVVYPQLIEVGYGKPPFPTAAVQAFCGDPAICSFTSETVYSHMYGATLRTTCRNK
ncbi:MAG: hypothetical protein B0W54_17115 [Cellvibrio sp. 79]|nr:MAG: hypothetical protein B0W54_17115 [Cellvibrio sp. 79]